MGKSEAHVVLGAMGGEARAKALSKEERSEIARKASRARWGDREERGTPKATHEGVLKIGELELPCWVLENGKRVLSQGGMIAALGMTRGSNPRLGGDRLANFAAGRGIKPFVSEDLASAILRPLKFKTNKGGLDGHGYEATTLADLCDAVLRARQEKALNWQQEKFAVRCELLVRGFARVGIIALVDEATGYQADRARDALAQILEAFIAKELRPYVKTFPADYYKEMFRLRKWDFPTEAHGTQRPPLVGKLTNNIVYARLAPGVLEELRKQVPRREDGSLKHHLHRKLTDAHGHPKLREHLASVVTIMKLSPDWDTFIRQLDRIHTKYGSTMEFDLGDLPTV